MASAPSKFDGQGQVFKAKLIGVENVPASRGDDMTQKALITMKAAVLVAKGHKPKIVLRISRSGVQIIDASNEQVLHDHVVTRISYIARDATDSRAFGYIYTAPDDKFLFIGIKTEKAAEQVVSALSELFAELLELKKKADAVTASSSATTTTAAAVAAAAAPMPALNEQAASAPSAEAFVAFASGAAAEQLVLPPVAPPAAAAAAVGPLPATYQPSAAAGIFELDSLLSVSQNQPIQQVQLAGYGGVQLSTAAGVPAQTGAWSIAEPPNASVIARQPVAAAAAWPSALPAQPQQQPLPAATTSFGVAASAFGQPFATSQFQPAPFQPAPFQPAPFQPAPFQPAPFQPAPFQPAPAASAALPLGAVQPGGPAAFNPGWQVPGQQPSMWASPESFANDPFFSTPSPFANASAAATAGGAAPLQPQKVLAPQAASAGGQQQGEVFEDAFAAIDLLGKQGQKPRRKDEFFSDIKNPPRKSLLEMAKQSPATQTAPEGANSNTSNVSFSSGDDCHVLNYDFNDAGDRRDGSAEHSSAAGSGFCYAPTGGGRLSSGAATDEGRCWAVASGQPSNSQAVDSQAQSRTPTEAGGSPLQRFEDSSFSVDGDSFDLGPPAYPPPPLPRASAATVHEDVAARSEALRSRDLCTCGADHVLQSSSSALKGACACHCSSAGLALGTSSSTETLPIGDPLLPAGFSSPGIQPASPCPQFNQIDAETNVSADMADGAVGTASHVTNIDYPIAAHQLSPPGCTGTLLSDGPSVQDDASTWPAIGSPVSDEPPVNGGRTAHSVACASPSYCPPPLPVRVRDHADFAFPDSSLPRLVIAPVAPAVPRRKPSLRDTVDVFDAGPPTSPPPSLPEHCRCQLSAAIVPPPPPPRLRSHTMPANVSEALNTGVEAQQPP